MSFFSFNHAWLCTNNILWLYFTFYILFSCFYLVWKARQKEVERWKKRFHLLVHSPNTYKGLSWGRLKAGSFNSIGVSHIGVTDKSTWTVICCFPRFITRNLDWKHAADGACTGTLLCDVGISCAILACSSPIPKYSDGFRALEVICHYCLVTLRPFKIFPQFTPNSISTANVGQTRVWEHKKNEAVQQQNWNATCDAFCCLTSCSIWEISSLEKWNKLLIIFSRRARKSD